jgi:hypothetical protein
LTIDPLSPGITSTVIPDNGIINAGGSGAEMTEVTAALVTVPAELVALIVYTVDVAGDTTVIPVKSTRPIPWSMLTDVAGGIGFGDGAGNVKQPGMRISSSSDKERKTNLFNLCTS